MSDVDCVRRRGGRYFLDESCVSAGGEAFRSAVDAAAKLSRLGFEAYVVGGALRDVLLGRRPSEADVATNAPPEVVQRAFPGARRVFPKRYCVFRLAGEGWVVEIARMRRDVASFGRQAEVSFTDDLREDLARRDFTVNAIAASPDLEIVDLFGGIDDLKRGLVRTIGDPEVRFEEDHVRLLRAVRFAAQLGFAVEPSTAEALRRKAVLAGDLSPQWVWRELAKALPYAPRFKELFVEFRLWDALFGDIFTARPNPRELSDALRAGVGDAALLNLFFLDRAQGFFSRMERLCERVEFPRRLRRRILAVAEVFEALPVFERLPAVRRVAVLESDLLREALAAASVCELLGEYAERLREGYPALGSPPLVFGGDAEALGVPPPLRAEALAQVRLAQLAGRISSRSEAMQMLKRVGAGRSDRR